MLMIAVALGSSAARILMQYDEGKSHPFLSANDRSRWATVRSLVENKTYEIDEIIADEEWDTIDKVQHANRNDVERFYSSKPPLLATMVAGVYWPIYHYDELKSYVVKDDVPGGDASSHDAPGDDEPAEDVSASADTAANSETAIHRFSLEKQPFDVSGIVLIFATLLPWFLFLLAIAKFVDRYGATTWGRMFVMATAAFGTYLTAFSTVLNNHLPAAASAAIAIYATCRIWIDGETKLRYFFLAGLFAAFTAAFELPGLALLGVLGMLCLLRAPGRTLLVGLPAAALVAAAFFGSNYAAHNTWEPPYMHRGEIENSFAVTGVDDPENWYDWAGSPWMSEDEVGLDAGESNTARYAFHALAGHHGIFSLTPVWILSLLGVLVMLLAGPGGHRRLLALLLLAVIAVVLCFWILYLPGRVRNYGGTSAGFREAHWLIPLMLVFLLPVADMFSKFKLLRGFALLLLIASVIATTYNLGNPWTHPIIFDWMIATGDLPQEMAL